MSTLSMPRVRVTKEDDTVVLAPLFVVEDVFWLAACVGCFVMVVGGAITVPLRRVVAWAHNRLDNLENCP